MKKSAMFLIFICSACSCMAQMLVYDQGTWAMLQNQTQIIQYWDQYMSQRLLNIENQTQTIRVNVERIRESVEKSEVRHGDPANIRTTIGTVNPSLSPLKDMASIEKKAEDGLKKDGRTAGKNPAEYDLRIRDTANAEASDRIMEAYGLRSEYMSKLSQLSKRLDIANTDVEVMKITAEIEVLHSALTALKAEEESQLRFGELEDRKREIDKKRIALIKSRKQAEDQRAANDKEMKYRNEKLEEARTTKQSGGEPDPNNLYSKILSPADPVANTDWTQAPPTGGSFPGFGGTAGAAGANGLTVEQLILLRISQIENNPALSDTAKEAIIKKLKEALGNAK